MRVLCILREIQDQLGLSKTDLERELSMDPRTIEKLLADSDRDPWRLDRDMLHRYVLFAHEHGFEAFRVEPHPIWKNFENSEEISIFRGPKKADVPVESLLVKYFERLNSQTHATTVAEGVEDSMKQHNCVFIGSPKSNRATEMALALLWEARPFDSQAKNCDRIPIHFLGMSSEQANTSALLRESSRHGFGIQIPGTTRRSYLKVDWLPPERYPSHQGDGQDGAVLVVCHCPLGTQKNVTTVVIAGYTGLATLVAAKEATYKKIPDLEPEATPGQPCFGVLKFRFKKRRQHRGSLDNLRTAEEESARWGPPWNDFFS